MTHVKVKGLFLCWIGIGWSGGVEFCSGELTPIAGRTALETRFVRVNLISSEILRTYSYMLRTLFPTGRTEHTTLQSEIKWQ